MKPAIHKYNMKWGPSIWSILPLILETPFNRNDFAHLNSFLGKFKFGISKFRAIITMDLANNLNVNDSMYPKNKTPCVCFTTFVCAIHRWAFDLVYNGHNHHLLFNFLSTHLSALWWWNSDIFGHKGSSTVLNKAFIAVSKSNLKKWANNSKNCAE